MTKSALTKIISLHKKWLDGKKGGKKADLHSANMRGANMSGADMRSADMRGANMRGADMRGADMRDANLDFSAWPLWCGSLNVKVDKKFAVQLAYHLCSLQCDDPEFIRVRNYLVPFANQMHRTDVPQLLKIKKSKRQV